MNEQEIGFEIKSVIERMPFENPTVQSFFNEWCKINDHIKPIIISRAEWEEKDNILEKKDNGYNNLYMPKDLQLWEMLEIMETIDKDTFFDNPEKQSKAKDDLLNLGETFQKAGIYIAKRLSSIDKGQDIAEVMAKEFYGYGESIINGKKSKDIKTIEEIESQELTDEDVNNIDHFLAGDNLYESRKTGDGNQDETKREETLNQFFRVSQKAFELQQRELKTSETDLRPWQDDTSIHNKFISRIEESIKREIEMPERELHSSIFRRGMDMLQKTMPFDKLPDNIKNGYLYWQGGETTLRQALQIDKLKTELDSVRQSGELNLISNKEREIADKIHMAIRNFPRKDFANNPSIMLADQEINCLGASMLGGALMQEVGLNYLVGNVPKHSILFLITSNGEVEWRDMLNPTDNVKLIDNEIDGHKKDGSPITVADIVAFSKNQKTEILRFDIKGEEYKKRFNWVKERQPQFVDVLKPVYGQEVQLLNNLGNALDNLGRNEEAVEACKQAIAINPEYTNIYSNLGIALDNLGRNEEAIEVYKQAIAINPEDANIYNNLGNALDNLGRNEEAIEAYNTFIKKTDRHKHDFFVKIAKRRLIYLKIKKIFRM